MEQPSRPEPFSSFTTPEFWDDPHISQQMLDHHLDPVDPRASRAHEFIDASVEWLVPALDLRHGSRVLDLGCGPGLYAERLARRGCAVLGVDVSRRSLAHAGSVAEAQSLPVTLVHGDYLQSDLGADHAAALLIYEDYCALSPRQRAHLLRRIREALGPSGRLVLDATSAARFSSVSEGRDEAPNLMNGFWSAESYTGVHETWTYPELRLVLDRYTIRTAGSTRQFWNWMHCLTPEQVSGELSAAGFAEPEIYGDVAGAPYAAPLPTFAALTQRS